MPLRIEAALDRRMRDVRESLYSAWVVVAASDGVVLCRECGVAIGPTEPLMFCTEGSSRPPVRETRVSVLHPSCAEVERTREGYRERPVPGLVQ